MRPDVCFPAKPRLAEWLLVILWTKQLKVTVHSRVCSFPRLKINSQVHSWSQYLNFDVSWQNFHLLMKVTLYALGWTDRWTSDWLSCYFKIIFQAPSKATSDSVVCLFFDSTSAFLDGTFVFQPWRKKSSLNKLTNNIFFTVASKNTT